MILSRPHGNYMPLAFSTVFTTVATSRADTAAMASAAYALELYRSSSECITHNDLHAGEGFFDKGNYQRSNPVPPTRKPANTLVMRI